MSNYVLPRVILGNRGDLASRWGVLKTLHQLGKQQVTIFCRGIEDIPALPYPSVPYGPIRNFYHTRTGWQALMQADTVLWSVGLDLQDDSSLAKIFYLLLNFLKFRLLGLKIFILFQGAGPLTTPIGRAVTKLLLGLVDTFVARDPGTYRLIQELAPRTKRLLAHDAIFLPGFEEEIESVKNSNSPALQKYLLDSSQPAIGINLRQWYHFSSSILPYQFSKESYRTRSLAKMQQVLAAYKHLIQQLLNGLDANVLLISAYQPGIVPWEDDLDWLAQVKEGFSNNERVLLLDDPLTMPEYYYLMSRLDLMIGMRLHSSLTALRFAVPSLNISYTLKGGDILNHLSLSDSVIPLSEFLSEPRVLFDRSTAIFQRQAAEKERIAKIVEQAIQTNVSALQTVLSPE
jgi:polysaccharide pyruvyl transferase WcaK-like protein